MSQEELRELTDRKVASAQCRWLKMHSYPFEIGASGKPKVLRAYLMQRLLDVVHTSIISEPNFDAIR